jgi:hypothetical protein
METIPGMLTPPSHDDEGLSERVVNSSENFDKQDKDEEWLSELELRAADLENDLFDWREAQAQSSGRRPRALSAFSRVRPPSAFASGGLTYRRPRPMRSRRQRALSASILIDGATIILGAGAIALVITQPDITRKSIWIISICVAVALVMLCCLLVGLSARKWLAENPSVPLPPDMVASRNRRQRVSDVRAGRDDARTNNQLLIDRYHQLTTQQAATSYRNSQYAMAVGLALLVAGSVVAIRSTSGSVQLVVGALTALGTTLSAYLGKTFIRTYERALLQMNYYFGQPLVTSYILEAERLSGKLSEAKRDDALSGIISETLLGAANASRALGPESQDQTVKRGSIKQRRATQQTTSTEDTQ